MCFAACVGRVSSPTPGGSSLSWGVHYAHSVRPPPPHPNASNMCVNCIRSQVDITEGIQKQVTVLWCKDCGRYLQPPKHWVRAEPESKELLTFCIKKVKGLSKVRWAGCTRRRPLRHGFPFLMRDDERAAHVDERAAHVEHSVSD